MYSYHDDISLLAGSKRRVEVLESLDGESRRQSEIAVSCAASRSTVNRIVGELCAVGWVTDSSGIYSLSAGGRHVLEQYRSLSESVEIIGKYGSFLTALGDTANTFPIEALADSDLVEATPEGPHTAISYFLDVMENTSSETLSGITPIVSPILDQPRSELLEAGVSVEIIVSDAVAGQLRSQESPIVSAAVSEQRFSLFATSQRMEFGCTILDDRVLIGAYDAAGNLTHCVNSTDDSVRQWTIDQYEDYKTNSVDLPRRAERPDVEFLEVG